VLLIDDQLPPLHQLVIPPGANMSLTARLQREHEAAMRSRPQPLGPQELASLVASLQRLLADPEYQHPEPQRCKQAAQLHTLLAKMDAPAAAKSGEALQQALEAIQAAVLDLAPCYGGSLAATRRLATAALWQLKQAAAAAGSWSGSHQRSLERPLAALQLLNQESQASRGIFEYTHVSKTGGTTMCALAGQASCLNPQLNEELNCMIRAFEDEPAWTLEVFAQVQEKQVSRPGRCVRWNAWPAAWPWAPQHRAESRRRAPRCRRCRSGRSVSTPAPSLSIAPS
jgi:hypothetical protein